MDQPREVQGDRAGDPVRTGWSQRRTLTPALESLESLGAVAACVARYTAVTAPSLVQACPPGPALTQEEQLFMIHRNFRVSPAQHRWRLATRCTSWLDQVWLGLAGKI